jgi:hypothetical protein
VETVGFNNSFRPGCWTPMVVRLRPTTSSPFVGRLEVVQEDLDKDQVIFTRQITLTGNSPDGSIKEQRFWMYFMPQPDPELEFSRSPADLTDMIRVRLVSESGKELVRLRITSKLQELESVRRGMSGMTQGKKVVMLVHRASAPNIQEYDQMIGLNERVWPFVRATELSQHLPDRVIGYDALDAVVWADADPMQLSPEQYKALQEYVARGGRLVILQDTSANQWQRNNAALAQLMPVVVESVGQQDELKTLRRLARVPERATDMGSAEYARPWNRLQGPFPYAVARVKDSAWVAEHNEGTPGPYIVRKPYGAGSVTWVAQDLGSKQFFGSNTLGWSYVWDRIFDWPNDPVYSRSGMQPTRESEQYKAHVTYELGKSMLKYMDLPSTSAALISIAVLFFIVYWVAAGPGSYLVLSKKGKATLSWFAFAALAIAATGLTWVIVKLVLRGDAQLQHVSYVRMAPGTPAIVRSNFGLYVPRDGKQKIELKSAPPGSAAYVTAFNLHPAFNESDIAFPAMQEYHLPVMEVQEQGGAKVLDPKVVEIPYRSTLKKYQSQWVGEIAEGITATRPITLLDDVTLAVTGTLRNDTGRDLRNVYIVFHYPEDRRDPEAFMPGRDFVLYAQNWAKGSEIDVAQVGPKARGAGQLREKSGPYHPDKNFPLIKGEIGVDRILVYGFARYWYDCNFRVDSWGDREFMEDEPLNPKTFPILSFFDRIPPCKNDTSGGLRSGKSDRVDLTRRGLRHLDMSSAITGGQMAIIAVADGKEEPLPFPMEVHGDPVKGRGVVYYQFVIPIDRKAVGQMATPKAATQPATAPATQPAKPNVPASTERADAKESEDCHAELAKHLAPQFEAVSQSERGFDVRNQILRCAQDDIAREMRF